MIVVLGATGNIGSKVTDKLLKGGKKVRALARGKEKLKALEARGAEARSGDAGDAAFLAKAFDGAEAVLTMIPTDLKAPDIAAYQDKVGEAIARALRDSKVQYVVEISSMGAQAVEGTGVVAGLARQEKRLDGLPGVNVLHLRPGYFMENFLSSAAMVKNMGLFGSPTRPDAKIHLIATEDIAKHAAERLSKRDWSGKTVQELLGPRDYTLQEVASILGKAVGKPDLPYVQFPYEDAVKTMTGFGISESVARNFVALNRAFNETDLFRTKARNAANTTPTTLEEFAPIFAGAYRNA
jgi:uncharacterized protein YbjT (DUF2867 family)